MRALFILSVCSVSLFAAHIQAEETPGLPVTVNVEREPVNTLAPISRAYLGVGSDKFTFLLPEKFHLENDAARGKIVLKNIDGEGVITLSFISQGPVESRELPPEPYRQMLAKRYDNARFGDTFTAGGANVRGPGFELEWKTADGLSQKTRAVYLPTVAGVLEVTVTSSAKNFSAAQANLGSVLGTLCASVNGKLEVNRVASQL